jgi:Leucine-rich repeat (LRR) protein
MTGLTQIDLRNNAFSGTFPTSIDTLPSLDRLDLSDVNGTWNALAPGFTSNTLTDLDMSGNNFTSAVFSQVNNITSLTELDLSDNALTGAIPTTIGNLLSLTDLDLSLNQLSGAVPTQITQLAGIEPFAVGEEGALGLCPNGALTTAAAPDPIQVFVDARENLWVNTSCTA